jgi:hypothetical protein
MIFCIIFGDIKKERYASMCKKLKSAWMIFKDCPTAKIPLKRFYTSETAARYEFDTRPLSQCGFSFAPYC